MYSHPTFVAMQLAERYEANQGLARSRQTGGGTPLLARIASIGGSIRPAFRPAAARPTIETAPQS